MKFFLPIISLFLTGCICLNPDHRRSTPPMVNTDKVIDNLKETKNELLKAGEANTEVGKSVDKALTLAEKLNKILEELEQSKIEGK